MSASHVVEVWGIPTCGTVKKTRAWLAQHGVEHVFLNFRETPPTKALMLQALKAVSHPKKLFNTSGISYKEGGWRERVDSLSADQVIAALLDDPMLIKRPIVRSSRGMSVGFHEEELMEILPGT